MNNSMVFNICNKISFKIINVQQRKKMNTDNDTNDCKNNKNKKKNIE